MKLRPENLSKGSIWKRYSMFVGTPREQHNDVEFTRYSYENSTGIYDVEIRMTDGDTTFRTNCGFEYQTPQNKYHKAILEYIGKAGK